MNASVQLPIDVVRVRQHCDRLQRQSEARRRLLIEGFQLIAKSLDAMIFRMLIQRPAFAVCISSIISLPILAADDASITRGKYLVDDVAQCGMCHTPTDENGKRDTSKYLKGGSLNVQPIQTVEKWHKTAPDITSTSRLWQRWGDAGFVKFLETALGPTEHPADPPMPAYKLSHEDAQAIVDYLKSLK